MIIEHRTGSVFEAQSIPGSILAHACNAKGVWGSGVAKEFKERFPNQYASYNWICSRPADVVWNPITNKFDPGTRVGTTHLAHCNVFGVTVACMITSNGYGKDVDPPPAILQATYSAFIDLLSQLSPPVKVHMPKINSGLFNVPWALTESVLKEAGEYFPDTHVVVWTPN